MNVCLYRLCNAVVLRAPCFSLKGKRRESSEREKKEKGVSSEIVCEGFSDVLLLFTRAKAKERGSFFFFKAQRTPLKSKVKTERTNARKGKATENRVSQLRSFSSEKRLKEGEKKS